MVEGLARLCSFGAALRRFRTSADLTQERLAERSGISAAGVAALKAGRRKMPRLNTVGLLCDALGVDSDQRAALVAAATRADDSEMQEITLNEYRQASADEKAGMISAAILKHQLFLDAQAATSRSVRW